MRCESMLWAIMTLIITSNLALAQEQSSEENEHHTLILPNETISKIIITKDEASYIYTECQQFAKDDGVVTESIDRYITLCTHELTQAVKTAKYRLANKDKKNTPNKSKKSEAPKPL